MDALPVRCPRCGCLSIAGLLIPPSMSLEEFHAPVEAVSGPARCPLCMTVISDDATKLANAICSVLREAKLDAAEVDLCLNTLTRHYAQKASHQETVKAIETVAPRAAALKRFIPSGDVTGALALVIAILSLVNDLIFDWVAPSLSQSGGGTAKHSTPSQERARWVKVSSFPTLPGRKAAGEFGGYMYDEGSTGE